MTKNIIQNQANSLPHSASLLPIPLQKTSGNSVYLSSNENNVDNGIKFHSMEQRDIVFNSKCQTGENSEALDKSSEKDNIPDKTESDIPFKENSDNKTFNTRSKNMVTIFDDNNFRSI